MSSCLLKGDCTPEGAATGTGGEAQHRAPGEGEFASSADFGQELEASHKQQLQSGNEQLEAQRQAGRASGVHTNSSNCGRPVLSRSRTCAKPWTRSIVRRWIAKPKLVKGGPFSPSFSRVVPA